MLEAVDIQYEGLEGLITKVSSSFFIQEEGESNNLPKTTVEG